MFELLGGWLAITNLVTTAQSTPPDLTVSMATDIHQLWQISSGNFMLRVDQINRLQQYIGEIKQFRFYCTKKWHGRTVHFTNKLNEFGLRFRDSCLDNTKLWLINGDCPDAFKVYSDDNSARISQCPYAHANYMDMNGYNIIYDHIIYHVGEATILFERLECDDLYYNAGFTREGHWFYFVR